MGEFKTKIIRGCNRSRVKEEMCNTMNSYFKYKSIPKSSFNKINILILPINTGKKYLKYSLHFAFIWTTSHYESIFRTVRLENSMTSCRDKLYHHTTSNKIKFNFLIIWFGKMSSNKSLPSSDNGVRNQKND